jgi:hypothetical protein
MVYDVFDMNKLHLIAAFSLLLSVELTYAQGQVNFANKVSAEGIDAPVKDPTGAMAKSM